MEIAAADLDPVDEYDTRQPTNLIMTAQRLLDEIDNSLDDLDVVQHAAATRTLDGIVQQIVTLNLIVVP